jgi:2-desacetyl-2-hydroxyethyl bacteriochlorophyllide A dehydrogenase
VTAESGAEAGAGSDHAGRRVRFVAPRRVEVDRTPVGTPSPDEVRVETTLSAISPGTELLVYRDQVPDDVSLDETIDSLDRPAAYPLSYGYAAVGTVTAAGTAVADEWIGRRVFAFHPHASHFCVTPDSLVPLPSDVADEDAALLAMVETAVSLAMDGRPRVGERVAVFGQGVVGLLTTALLARFPLARLVTFDRYPDRRERSRALGADASLPPDGVDDAFEAGDGRADLSYEVSGNPDALDAAIETTGDDGRVVVGSWYGSKPTTLDLGGRFHRSHIRLQASQVSRIDPAHAGRWDKDRRMDLVLDRLADLQPSQLVTHRLPVEEAPRAYQLLDRSREEALQVLFEY